MELKRRYWLFGFDTYYPNGGLGDRLSTHDTLDAAKAAGRACGKDTWYVHDVLHDVTEYADCDEPLPVDLLKPGDTGGPLYQSLPVIQASRAPIVYAMPPARPPRTAYRGAEHMP